MADKVDYYSVLGCDPSSSEDQIRTEFRLRARQSHPDKDGSKEEFQARLSVIFIHLFFIFRFDI